MRKVLLTILILFSHNIFAEKSWNQIRFANLAKGISYEISSGTGFFVNDNYIITNQHVVENCRNIAARGAIKPTPVSILAVDEEYDLALLYSPNGSNHHAKLEEYPEHRIFDDVYTIGYPLEYSKIGKFVIGHSQILDHYVTKKENYHLSHIEFSGRMEHGNSGGPILDKNHNIIGIVKAKKSYFTEDGDKRNVVKVTGIGISSSLITQFLSEHGVNYKKASISQISQKSEDNSKNYIVNIHCVK